MNKAIFLDRDGTINVDNDYIYLKEDFEFIPGAIEALKIFQDMGYVLIIITNQSGIARGYYTIEDFYKLNQWMMNFLKKHNILISRVYFCPHHKNAKILKYRCDCECRKPKIGMYNKAIQDFDLDIKNCIAVGDKIRDCSICFTTECRGYLIGENEDNNIINNVKIGVYDRIQYKKTLYDVALSISEDG